MYFWWVREYFFKVEDSKLGLLLQQIPFLANEFDKPQLANTGNGSHLKDELDPDCYGHNCREVWLAY